MRRRRPFDATPASGGLYAERFVDALVCPGAQGPTCPPGPTKIRHALAKSVQQTAIGLTGHAEPPATGITGRNKVEDKLYLCVIRRNYMRVRLRGLSVKTVFVMETAEDRLRRNSAAYGKQMAV